MSEPLIVCLTKGPCFQKCTAYQCCHSFHIIYYYRCSFENRNFQLLFVFERGKKGETLKRILMQIYHFPYEIIQAILKTSLNLNSLTENYDWLANQKLSPRHPISSREEKKREKEKGIGHGRGDRWEMGRWDRRRERETRKSRERGEKTTEPKWREKHAGQSKFEREEVTEERMQTKEEEG